MELLQNPADRGYPPEYLLSRIRGRRSRLIREWRPLIADPVLLESHSSAKAGVLQQVAAADGMWRNLIREYEWVYGQMDLQTRDIFHPFFLHVELRTLFICLRHITDRKTGTIDGFLRNSLLSDKIKGVLLLSADLRDAVNGIELLFLSRSKKFAGIAVALETGGLRGVEQRLTETCLADIAASTLHPFMRMFFSRIIDARNIMSLYKYLRLDLKTVPPVIPGGAVPEKRLRAAYAKKDISGIGPLIRELTGITVERPDSTQVELALYRGITRWLRKAGRDPFGAAPVLDYLWRCSIEAMNLSVLHRTGEREREAVEAELVQ